MVHHKTAERIFRIASSLPPTELSLNDALNLEKAQQLCWTAMECVDNEEATDLAVEATKLTTFCADAFLILADSICYNQAERLILLHWATRVGELCCRARIAEDTGHLHGFLDARPYMRARTQLAWTLRELGCYEEAVAHYEELLRVERNDHIAIGMLITGYLELRRFEDAKKLIEEREENGGTHLRYGEMVRRYLIGEQGPTLRDAMTSALWANQHVPTLLDNPKTEVMRSPFGVSSGGADEAAEYIEVSHRFWDAHPKMKRVLIVGAGELLPGIESERQQRIRKWRGEA